MSFSIDVKDYSIAAGERKRISLPGTFFQLMEATAAVDVDFVRSHSVLGHAVDVPLGFSVGPLPEGQAFDGVDIYSATAQTVKVCIARGAVDLRALTQVTGTVSVINGEVLDVKSGVVFAGNVGAIATVGSYGHCQLWNPLASGVNLVVSKMWARIDTAAQFVHIGKTTAAMANAGTLNSNKLFGGAAANGQIRYEVNAAILGTSILHIVNEHIGSKEFPFAEPFVVPPGYGIHCLCATVNVGIWTAFQWKEETI